MRAMSYPRALTLALAFTLLSCGAPASPALTVLVTPAEEDLFTGYAATLEGTVTFVVVDDPVAALASHGGRTIAVVADRTDPDTYELEHAADGYVVHGDAPLGVAYGLTHLLESMGYGFYHPYRSRVPSALRTPSPAIFGVAHAPEKSVRGLHLHTLHPIEGYFDVWEPSPENLEGAKRIVDWVVKGRGNYLQWPGLDDIQDSDPKLAAWLEHTEAIIAYAHAHGVEIGLGIQLFGQSNLQNAFDLIDDEEEDPAVEIPERLDRIAALDLDNVNLSFGEFFGADPATFIATLDLAVTASRQRFPNADVSGVVHVGNFPNLNVTYMGETFLYYYLVKYAADPAFVPWIHTVMYYDLFEDAGGAYGYDEFTGHREYLFERLEASQPVAYFPETAYWIAFDNPIPQYLPLYVRSRYNDLARIRARAAEDGHDDLDQHIVFSSGWEWGYWQNDWASLRMSYELPDSWESLFEEMLAPYGGKGERIAAVLEQLTRDQHANLIEGRLSAYMASRDATFALGDAMGFFSQPRRPSFPAIAAYSAEERAAFRGDVVARLDAYADTLDARLRDLNRVGVGRDPWLVEIRDGIEATALRAHYAVLMLEATLAFGDGDVAAAEALLADAQPQIDRVARVVQRRHGALHDPRSERILSHRAPNAGLYKYGYLRETDTQCFYYRELREVTNLVRGENASVPGCVL